MTAEPGGPQHHLHETTDSRQLDTVLLRQLAEEALKPDMQFGRDLNLTTAERDELMTVVDRANEVLAPRYEDPDWKRFTAMARNVSDARRPLDLREGEGTRVPSWCLDGGPSALVQEVRYRDKSGPELKGLIVPSHIFNLLGWTNTISTLRGYATHAYTMPNGWPTKDMGLALRDLTQLLAVQAEPEPAKDSKPVAEEPVPPSPVDSTDQEQEQIPREPTNLLGLDPSRLKKVAEEIHHYGASSDQLRHVYDENLRRRNPVLTELVHRVGERIEHEWDLPARTSFNRGFTLGYLFIDHASAEGAPNLSFDVLKEASGYQKQLELEDLQGAADALLQNQTTLNEAFNQALLGLPDGTDTFIARMGGGVALLGELIAQEDNATGSI